ncbi:hypothetical protein [Blastococcus sp. CCUG 61487]|uniref:hypothetical protein n=1 Tax=Blastococcus sp. CCUG 61487 TaxID=1840703 RepID=UPI0011398320|nr:hypothetical protein [Blastococcus sp. CCUG 61487]TKJ25260.1 hypothetical protein A6V29_04360 [Blastococcus sp. CCUG 61487]
MTTVVERPVGELRCIRRHNGQPCTGRPVVRYFIGPVCSADLMPGAEVYEWLVVPDEDLAARPPVDSGAGVVQRTSYPLPDPARPAAAVHADATAGEATAARLVAYRAGSLRARVLQHLVQIGPQGTTAIEAWNWYRRSFDSKTERYSVAPRLSELVADGWAVKTGQLRNVRGPGCPPEEVYVLSPRGRRAKGVIW